MTVISGATDCSSGLAQRIFNNLCYDSKWAATTSYAVGARACPTTPNGFGYVVTAVTTGISGVSEPTWPLVLTNTVIDGGVTWTCQDVANPDGRLLSVTPGYVLSSSDLDGFRLLAYDIARAVVEEVNGNKVDLATQVSGALAAGLLLVNSPLTGDGSSASHLGIQDASASQSGGVNTGAQTFAGAKTFNTASPGGLTQEAWTGLSFGANWGNLGIQPCGFFKDSHGVIHLRGCAQTSAGQAANSTLGTLPVGYRPALREIFSVFTNKGAVDTTLRIDIFATGAIVISPAVGINDYVSISGITFDTR